MLFPYDVKQVTLDIHSGTSGVLLASANNIRTILYTSISCNSVGDYNIVASSTVTQPSQDNVVATEAVNNLERFVYHTYPANTPFYWRKPATNDKCTFKMLYTDYDYSMTASTTPPEITYYDWLFVSQVQILLLSLLAFGIIFSFFRK